MIRARKLDRILVVDVEATCWEGDLPTGQTSEIFVLSDSRRNRDRAARIRKEASHSLNSGYMRASPHGCGGGPLPGGIVSPSGTERRSAQETHVTTSLQW